MRFMLVLIPLFLLCACDSGTSAPDYRNVTVAFALSDTLGRLVSSFHSGEDFDVQFSVLNESGGTLTYFFTGVPVVLSIYAADTLVASDIDGYVFPQVVLGGTLPTDGLYADDWRAPSTDARTTHLVLQPGTYEARVSHGPFFREFRLAQTPPIPFVVLP